MDKVILFKFVEKIGDAPYDSITIASTSHEEAFEEVKKHTNNIAKIEVAKEVDLHDLIVNKGVTLVIHNTLLPF